MRRAATLLVSCLLTTFCTGTATVHTTRRVSASSAVKTMFDVARVEQVLPIDRSLRFRLASVDVAHEDRSSNSLLLLDALGTKLLYRISVTGAPMAAYSLHNPTNPLEAKPRDFTVLDSGEIIVLDSASGLLRLSRNGALIQQRALDFAGYNVVSVGDKVYVRASYQRGRAHHDVYVFDANLNPLGSFHDADPRVSKYTFIPFRSLTTLGNEIIVAGAYDLSLARYSTDGRLLGAYQFDSIANRDLEIAWAKPRLTEIDRRVIRLGTQRFFMIQGVGERLFAYERSDVRRLNRLHLLPGDLATTIEYPALHLLPINPTVASSEPVFDRVVGTYPRGLIVLIEDAARLPLLAKASPAFADISLRDTDNPILVYLDFSSMTARDTTGARNGL